MTNEPKSPQEQPTAGSACSAGLGHADAIEQLICAHAELNKVQPLLTVASLLDELKERTEISKKYIVLCTRYRTALEKIAADGVDHLACQCARDALKEA